MNNVKRTKALCAQGHVHDSKAEAKRCNELHCALLVGEISDLEIQKPFLLIPARKYRDTDNERKVDYVCDFAYTQDGRHIVEDIKSDWTKKDPVYILKRKMFKEKYSEEYTFKEVVRK